jgi:hypothetical protein
MAAVVLLFVSPGVVVALRKNVVEGLFLSGGAFLLFGLLSLNAILSRSAVAISDDCIAWMAFGLKWKSIVWTNVRTVSVASILQFPSNEKRKFYYINQGQQPRGYQSKGGSIFFSEDIKEFEQLRVIVNEQIRRYGIQVRFLGEPDRTATQI